MCGAVAVDTQQRRHCLPAPASVAQFSYRATPDRHQFAALHVKSAQRLVGCSCSLRWVSEDGKSVDVDNHTWTVGSQVAPSTGAESPFGSGEETCAERRFVVICAVDARGSGVARRFCSRWFCIPPAGLRCFSQSFPTYL